jgi:hypothetical protein
MNSPVFSPNDLEALIARLVPAAPDDELSHRIAALCQGLFDHDERIDLEWANRFQQLYTNWLTRLKATELSYNERVSVFFAQCRATPAHHNIAQLFDPLGRVRIERSLAAITEYFESVMPEALMADQQVELAIDVSSSSAWWTADREDRGIELATVIHDCLRSAGEFGEDATAVLCPFFVDALLDGTMPLPGFDFGSRQDEVVTWVWKSPIEESDAWLPGVFPREDITDLARTSGNCESLFEKFNSAFLPVALSGLPLSQDAPGIVHELAHRLFEAGMPGQQVLRDLGRPLGIVASRASDSGDMAQFAIANSTMTSLVASLREHEEFKVT